MSNTVCRCDWAKHTLEIDYHDTEWGVPVKDDQKWFEFIVLDSFQAGLSWLTILKKREGFRKAFDNFDYKKIAKYDEEKVQKLIEDETIIRNKLKIRGTVQNAKAFLEVQKEFGSFNKFIWDFIGNKPVVNVWKERKDVPASTPLSDKLSKELIKRGFKFVGTTICYAFMQASGLVNDHLESCFRYEDVKKLY